MSDWKDKKCGNCNFRVDLDCRRFPPQFLSNEVHNKNKHWPQYPNVNGAQSVAGHWKPACAEFKEQPQ